MSDTTPQVDLPRRIRHLVGVTGKSSIPKGRFSQRLLGERIDAARETAGLSQVDLAERIGIDKGAYTRKVRAPIGLFVRPASCLTCNRRKLYATQRLDAAEYAARVGELASRQSGRPPLS